MSAGSIPVIDLAAWPDDLGPPPAGLVDQIAAALHDVGFMVLVGHGVDESVVAAAFHACAAFHAQPLEAKQAVALDRNNNGYMPIKSTTIRSSTVAENIRADLNEAFFFRPELGSDHPDVVAGRRFRGLNQWPAAPAGFRAEALAYAAAMAGLAARLRQPLALALDLPADWFASYFAAPQWVTRFSHYLPSAPGEAVYGLAPHTDASFFTLLPQTDVPGLEVRLPSGAWIAPPYMPGSFIFNSGDMLHRWSNGRLPSTPHRANPPVGRDRYAIPFFYGPDWDAEIRPAPTCVAPGTVSSWPPITYADYMAWWYETNYATAHPTGVGKRR